METAYATFFPKKTLKPPQRRHRGEQRARGEGAQPRLQGRRGGRGHHRLPREDQVSNGPVSHVAGSVSLLPFYGRSSVLREKW